MITFNSPGVFLMKKYYAVSLILASSLLFSVAFAQESNRENKKEVSQGGASRDLTIKSERYYDKNEKNYKEWSPSLYEGIDFIGKPFANFKLLRNHFLVMSNKAIPKELESIEQKIENNNGLTKTVQGDDPFDQYKIDTQVVTFGEPKQVTIFDISPREEKIQQITPLIVIKYTRDAITSVSFRFMDSKSGTDEVKIDKLKIIRDSIEESLLKKGFSKKFIQSYFDSSTCRDSDINCTAYLTLYRKDLKITIIQLGKEFLTITIENEDEEVGKALVEKNKKDDQVKIRALKEKYGLLEPQANIDEQSLNNFISPVKH